MQLKFQVLTSIALLVGLTEAWFSIPLRPLNPPPAAPPAASQCQGTLQFRPLGSFLLGPLFPNPWSGLGGNFNVPNCNAPPVTPTPWCPSGQSCQAPCPAPPVCPAGQSCQLPPRQPPPGQAAADATCNNAAGGGTSLKACLDVTGRPIYCCTA
jgi:hypothetical protein